MICLCKTDRCNSLVHLCVMYCSMDGASFGMDVPHRIPRDKLSCEPAPLTDAGVVATRESLSPSIPFYRTGRGGRASDAGWAKTDAQIWLFC